jgi:hypothetical protein
MVVLVGPGGVLRAAVIPRWVCALGLRVGSCRVVVLPCGWMSGMEAGER